MRKLLVVFLALAVLAIPALAAVDTDSPSPASFSWPAQPGVGVTCVGPTVNNGSSITQFGCVTVWDGGAQTWVCTSTITASGTIHTDCYVGH